MDERCVRFLRRSASRRCGPGSSTSITTINPMLGGIRSRSVVTLPIIEVERPHPVRRTDDNAKYFLRGKPRPQITVVVTSDLDALDRHDLETAYFERVSPSLAARLQRRHARRTALSTGREHTNRAQDHTTAIGRKRTHPPHSPRSPVCSKSGRQWTSRPEAAAAASHGVVTPYTVPVSAGSSKPNWPSTWTWSIVTREASSRRSRNERAISPGVVRMVITRRSPMRRFPRFGLSDRGRASSCGRRRRIPRSSVEPSTRTRPPNQRALQRARTLVSRRTESSRENCAARASMTAAASPHSVTTTPHIGQRASSRRRRSRTTERSSLSLAGRRSSRPLPRPSRPQSPSPSSPTRRERHPC